VIVAVFQLTVALTGLARVHIFLLQDNGASAARSRIF
jgi:Tfp pilus assembly protein PilV